MENVNFVAFDFETADKDMPCQLGITKVRKGEIIESKSWLIKPPNNQYNLFTIAVHGITPDKTKNSPIFPEIWQEVQCYLENNIVVAHNASYDLRVLRKVADHYKMDIAIPDDVICTCSLHGRQNLASCCSMYGIDMIKHHDANSDSDACANILLNYMDQNNDPYLKDLFHSWTSRNFSEEENEEEDLKRKICLIGKPSNKGIISALFNKTEFIKQTLPSKNTELVIFCNTEDRNIDLISDKLIALKHNGYTLNVLSEADVLKRIADNTIQSLIIKPEKKLNITYDSILSQKYFETHVYTLQTDTYLHELGNKEIYIHDDIKNRDLLSQCLGNLGAFPTYSLEESTNLIWLDQTTVEKLKNGEKTNLINDIESFYDKSDSITFSYKFVLDSNIYAFIENWIADGQDEIMIELFERYKESEYVRMDQEYSDMHKQYKFGKSHYVKQNNIYYFRLKDGRVWVPSRQAEP